MRNWDVASVHTGLLRDGVDFRNAPVVAGQDRTRLLPTNLNFSATAGGAMLKFEITCVETTPPSAPVKPIKAEPVPRIVGIFAVKFVV